MTDNKEIKNLLYKYTSYKTFADIKKTTINIIADKEIKVKHIKDIETTMSKLTKICVCLTDFTVFSPSFKYLISLRDTLNDIISNENQALGDQEIKINQELVEDFEEEEEVF